LNIIGVPRLVAGGTCHRGRKKMSIRSEWEQMIREGLLVPTGEMRRNRKGELEPVYVVNDELKVEYEKFEAAFAVLFGTRRGRR
jgi:hypothetical protein